MESNRDVLFDPATGRGEALTGLQPSRLSSLVSDAPAIARELLAGSVEERADAHLVFESVTAIMGKALGDHNDELFSEGIGALGEVWRVGDHRAMYPLITPDFEASLWEALSIELYALGAKAVGHERWKQIRSLTRQRPDPSSSKESWLRQGQVASARSTPYPEDTVLWLAKRRLLQLEPALTEGEALEKLCQFDFLSGLIISETDPNGYYPNAAEFPESFVEPLVIDYLRKNDSPLRQHVYPGDAQGLRDALRDYDHMARSQAAYSRRAQRNWRWRAFAYARTWAFINEGQMLEDWESDDGWT